MSLVNILTRDHLQPISSRPLHPRQHGNPHHAKAMEMGLDMCREESQGASPTQPFIGHQRGRETRAAMGIKREIKILHHAVQKLTQNR